jgi:hypothetical protein
MERMEKRNMANVCRGLVVIIALSFFAALSAHAQLINGGFETAGTNYIFPDNGDGSFPVLTNLFAADWTPIGATYVTRDATNSPQVGTYEDLTAYDYVGCNSTASNTAHSGTYALRAFGPFGSTASPPGGSGAFQLITSNQNAAVSNYTYWVFSGYLMNWSGDPMNDTGGADPGFGLIQIVFQGTNGEAVAGGASTFDGPHLGMGTITNTWISCSVTAQAPKDVSQIAFYCLHVGQEGNQGSVFFDDLSATYLGPGSPPPPPPQSVTNQLQAVIQAGNRICWPTISYASYQAQYSDDNTNWTSIGSLLPGDGTTNCVFGFTHKFYRVLREQ